MSDSYYELLGVDPDASEEEIKTAYREKVKQVHPDKSDSPDAKERFMQVREARKVLLDPEERAQYDRHRANDEGPWDAGNQNQNHQQQRQQRRSNDSEKKRNPYQSQTQTSRQTKTETRERERKWKNNIEHDNPVSTVWIWSLAIFENIVRTGEQFLGIVRSPESLSVDRSLINSLVTSPTGIRLSATATLILVFTVLAQYFGYAPRDSTSLGLGIVLFGLVGSYTGYEILSPLPFEEPWTQSRSRYDPEGRQRIWPIAVTNAVGVGLVSSAFLSGAPYGGVAFTGALLLPFAIPLLFYSRSQPTHAEDSSMPRTFELLFTDSYRFMSVIATVVIVTVLFTHLLVDTPDLLTDLTVAGPSPWFGNISLGYIRVSLLLNFVIGVVMFACILWSMYAMWRYLSAAPWTDRYDHGYRVRPGVWNLLVAGPFVVFAWMVLAGVTVIEIPLGISTLIITQDMVLMGLFFLPSVLTGLYILRRHLEPKIRRQVYHRP
jgi:hypothetical protein